jgi:GDP-L-fucose synthase
MDLTQERVLVTGGAGFLGSHVVELLKARGARDVVVVRSRDCDLVDRQAVARLIRDVQPSSIVHLAARVGGIGANQKNPGSYFHDNLLMGVNLVDEARAASIGKIVLAGTICSYPKHTPVPFREEELWNGYPEETNAPYGVAKKALFVMADAYRRQYGLNAVCLLPVNLYGPRDNFDLESSHVIPAMIRKFIEANAAGRDEVVLWGDGTPTREFLYVEDCARAIVLALERYDGSEPVNLGAGFEISMRELAEKIAVLCEFRGRLRWDTSRPNGQPRRSLDTRRAQALFGFSAEVSFDDGLRRTIDWYRRSS